MNEVISNKDGTIENILKDISNKGQTINDGEEELKAIKQNIVEDYIPKISNALQVIQGGAFSDPKYSKQKKIVIDNLKFLTEDIKVVPNIVGLISSQSQLLHESMSSFNQYIQEYVGSGFIGLRTGIQDVTGILAELGSDHNISNERLNTIYKKIDVLNGRLDNQSKIITEVSKVLDGYNWTLGEQFEEIKSDLNKAHKSQEQILDINLSNFENTLNTQFKDVKAKQVTYFDDMRNTLVTGVEDINKVSEAGYTLVDKSVKDGLQIGIEKTITAITNQMGSINSALKEGVDVTAEFNNKTSLTLETSFVKQREMYEIAYQTIIDAIKEGEITNSDYLKSGLSLINETVQDSFKNLLQIQQNQSDYIKNLLEEREKVDEQRYDERSSKIDEGFKNIGEKQEQFNNNANTKIQEIYGLLDENGIKQEDRDNSLTNLFKSLKTDVTKMFTKSLDLVVSDLRLKNNQLQKDYNFLNDEFKKTTEEKASLYGQLQVLTEQIGEMRNKLNKYDTHQFEIDRIGGHFKTFIFDENVETGFVEGSFEKDVYPLIQSSDYSTNFIEVSPTRNYKLLQFKNKNDVNTLDEIMVLSAQFIEINQGDDGTEKSKINESKYIVNLSNEELDNLIKKYISDEYADSLNVEADLLSSETFESIDRPVVAIDAFGNMPYSKSSINNENNMYLFNVQEQTYLLLSKSSLQYSKDDKDNKELCFKDDLDNKIILNI